MRTVIHKQRVFPTGLAQVGRASRAALVWKLGGLDTNLQCQHYGLERTQGGLKKPDSAPSFTDVVFLRLNAHFTLSSEEG